MSSCPHVHPLLTASKYDKLHAEVCCPLMLQESAGDSQLWPTTNKTPLQLEYFLGKPGPPIKLQREASVSVAESWAHALY